MLRVSLGPAAGVQPGASHSQPAQGAAEAAAGFTGTLLLVRTGKSYSCVAASFAALRDGDELVGEGKLAGPATVRAQEVKLRSAASARRFEWHSSAKGGPCSSDGLLRVAASGFYVRDVDFFACNLAEDTYVVVVEEGVKAAKMESCGVESDQMNGRIHNGARRGSSGICLSDGSELHAIDVTVRNVSLVGIAVLLRAKLRATRVVVQNSLSTCFWLDGSCECFFKDCKALGSVYGVGWWLDALKPVEFAGTNVAENCHDTGFIFDVPTTLIRDKHIPAAEYADLLIKRTTQRRAPSSECWSGAPLTRTSGPRFSQ